LREAWDGDTLANRTKGRKVVATNAHVSILAGCTPEELRRLVTATDVANGFLNRFLIVAVASERSRRRPKRIPLELVAEFSSTFAKALSFGRRQGLYEHDDAAGELWDEVYVDELNVERPGLAGEATARAPTHTLRLSLLYALLDHSTKIREAHVRAALALWRYCELSTRMVFGETIGNPVADAIVAELERRAPNPLTRTGLRDLFSRHRTLAEIEQALDELEQLQVVRVERQGTGGRPTESIRLATCTKHPDAGRWRGRDNRWRCRECEPPAFTSEVVEEAPKCRAAADPATSRSVRSSRRCGCVGRAGVNCKPRRSSHAPLSSRRSTRRC
jgi:hypothetical protein